MMVRPLSPDENSLWRRVTRDVRPLTDPEPQAADLEPLKPAATAAAPRGAGHAKASAPQPAAPPGTLNGTWDRQLRRGASAPDVTIDLHGHSLASAHRALGAALDRAVASEVRLMLIVTGKPPRGGGSRGAIRAAIGDWLGGSPHAGRIAALRNAHPRHGGEGALYLVLRRTATKGSKRIL